MDFYIQFGLIFFGGIFLMALLPLLDVARAEGKSLEFLWKTLEVGGLWLAAGVGLIAVYVASHDSHEQIKELIEQAKAMNEQVKEAQTQRLMLVEQNRARLRIDVPRVSPVLAKQPDGTQKLTGWAVSPAWVNTGSTTAKSAALWYGMALIPKPFNVSFVTEGKCPALPDPEQIPRSDVMPGSSGLLLAKVIPIERLIAASTGAEMILLYGHLDYHDVYPDTPLHVEDWCIALYPNNIDQMTFSPINIFEKFEDRP